MKLAHLDYDTLRRHVNEAAQEDGLSFAEVARRTGMDPAALSRFRSGERKGLPVESVLRLTEWLHRDIFDYVVHREVEV